MPLILGANTYGKRQIRLLKVNRQTEPHQIRDLTVSILCRGDFESAFVAGDNREVLPTDTMKNTVYALAAGQPLAAIEDFGLAVAGYFLTHHHQIAGVEVEIHQDIWQPLSIVGAAHLSSFGKATERRTASILATRESHVLRSGLTDLQLMKTSGSAFANFTRDHYTTLPDTYDRVLQSTITAVWSYIDPQPDYDSIWERVRSISMQSFAEHESRSVQHTLYAIGQAVLTAVPQLADIELTLPNQHCLPVDLAPFGLEQQDNVFLPISEPHGLITARVLRCDASQPAVV